jgi:adenylate kinase family enzyme
MRIHIFGASGSGVTTLGNALGKKLNYPYFDSDQFFWIPTEPPYTIKRPPEERNQLINQQTALHNNWILGGSVVSWDNNWDFDLSVFLYIPPAVRLERLRKRELERYGDIIFTDPERKIKTENFLQWAANYDENLHAGRSLQVHQTWIENLATPILIIEGDTTVSERIAAILLKIEELERK